jgi:hypothetical protein
MNFLESLEQALEFSRIQAKFRVAVAIDTQEKN